MEEKESQVDLFPENSRWQQADNPETLNLWLKMEVDIRGANYPFLMLCRDCRTGAVTWHIFCNERNIRYDVEKGRKPLIDAWLSIERQRELEGIELLSRAPYVEGHMFLGNEEETP